jgi:lipoprotein-releasing system permease protein
MNLAFHIARRYLFAKKSHNAINIISAISAGGVCVGTMAMVCVLSVFNGFEGLIQQLFSNFDPDLKIELVEGKAFNTHTQEWNSVRQLKDVAYFNEIVEDNAMLRYKDRQLPATIKGVGPNFQAMVMIDSLMVAGNFVLYDGVFENGVMGVGLAGALGTGSKALDPILVYTPKRTASIDLVNPESSFNRDQIFLSGIFSIKQAVYDDKYFIVSLGFARRLFDYGDSIATSVDLKLKPNADVDHVQQIIRKQLGAGFKVMNRYEQQDDYFRIMKIEKWMTYLILSFILLIAVFNIIGSLSMLIIDKEEDIQTLRNLGAENRLIQRIFLFEGWLISVGGAIAGVVLGLALCFGQYYFGWIKLQGSGFIINSYPVLVEWTDVVLVLFTVLIMGFLAAIYPVRYLRKELLKNNKDNLLV